MSRSIQTGWSPGVFHRETIVPFLRLIQVFFRVVEGNPEKIQWYVSQNPEVFYLLELDYPTMKENARELQEELAGNLSRMCRMAARGVDMPGYLSHF